MRRRHLILVGLPGSGKTTVGTLAAATLGAPFVDLDAAIERRVGKPVARIFAEDGEAAFRALEAELGAAVLTGPPSVVAPGAGFLAAAVTPAAARESGLVVYLQTDPAVAAARLGGAAGRPLLDGAAPAERLAALLEAREPLYAQAECVVKTAGRTPEAVAAEVASLARERAGW